MKIPWVPLDSNIINTNIRRELPRVITVKLEALMVRKERRDTQETRRAARGLQKTRAARGVQGTKMAKGIRGMRVARGLQGTRVAKGK